MVMAGATNTNDVTSAFAGEQAGAVLRAQDSAPPSRGDAVEIRSESTMASDQKIAGSVGLKNRIQILPHKPLPQFDTVCANAFEASINGDLNRKCLAMIIKPGMPARMNVIESISGISMSGVMSVVDYGPVDWPLTSDKRMAVIMDRPMGEKFLPANTHIFPKMSEADIMRAIAIPITSALRQMANKGLTFRGINLYNMYWEDSSKQKLMFGDCFTIPPGYGQPTVFESNIGAMCDPAARSDGTITDDLFSLGVLILFLAIGRNPMADKQDDWLINSRIEL